MCSAGDSLIRISRPHPGFTIERISRGLWGDDGDKDTSEEFLEYVANMDELIERHFKDTARLRLDRIRQRESTDGSL
jgi:hypothetical protein